jgi:hypothetical protein
VHQGIPRDAFAEASHFRTSHLRTSQFRSEFYACMTSRSDAFSGLWHAFGRGESKHQMVPGWPYSV